MKKTVIKSLLACTMTLSLLVGCANTGSNTGSEAPVSSENKESQSVSSESKDTEVQTPAEEELSYPLEGGKTLSIAWYEEAAVTANAKDLGETPFGKAWQEQTGITLEVLQLADTDAMNLMLAGGDLPDIIWMDMNAYGATKAIKDKVALPLNDYLEEYAPDLYTIFEENPYYKKLSSDDNGQIVGFPMIRGSEYLLTSAGMMIREDWLEDLNLEVPETPDEVYNALKAFKEEKGATVPFSTSTYWINDFVLGYGMITSAFGLASGNFYQVDGQVHWGRTEAEYKDALAWLNKLYNDDLLDPNFQTIDGNTCSANIMNGDSGMTVGSVGGNLGTYINTMKETNPEYSLTGIKPLVVENGDIPMSTFYGAAVNGWFAVITPQCEDVETAVKFLNYGYTEAGHMLFNFGIEGESYTVEDGVAYYTDLIHNNPDGLSKQFAMAQYQRAWNGGPFVQDEQYMREYSNMPQQVQALTNWTNSNAKDYFIPSLAIAEEDVAEYNRLKADLDTYIKEMTIKFITGEEPLDNFEKEYLPMLEKLKAARVIEIQQDALDAFNAR